MSFTASNAVNINIVLGNQIEANKQKKNVSKRKTPFRLFYVLLTFLFTRTFRQ